MWSSFCVCFCLFACHMVTRAVSHFLYGTHLLHIEIKTGQQRIVPVRVPSFNMFPSGALLFISTTSLKWFPRFRIYFLLLLHIGEIPETVICPHAVSRISLKQRSNLNFRVSKGLWDNIFAGICWYCGSPEAYEGIRFVLLKAPCIFPLKNN